MLVEAHIPTPEPPQTPDPRPPSPLQPPRPIDDPPPQPSPPVSDPAPDEQPNPKRYGPAPVGRVISSGRTHSSYCDSLT
jgi:hypothetical protein